MLLDSQYIGHLGVDEIKEATLSITPTKLGELRIVGNITADNETNKENNQFYGYLNVVPEGPDVTGDFYEATYPMIVDQEGQIRIRLENIGTQRAENVQATLYEEVNGTLNEIASINKDVLGSNELHREEVSWTPTRGGLY